MALNAYLWLTVDGSDVEGSVTREESAGSIEVVAFHHELSAPHEPGGGARTGRLHHGELIIVTPLDKCSPLIRQALVQNQIAEATLKLWRPDETGAEVQYYEMQLVNARVASIRMEMLNNQYPDNANHRVYERVGFMYETIIWTWIDGGPTAEASTVQAV
jgi:type VI secretion system secreted protein Hcp